MEKAIRLVKKEKIFLLILITSLLLRLAYLSPWLEDWDSIQFALAIKDFDLVNHQPHPPGYILYIFLGRIINFFLQNNTLSLTFISAVLGSLSSIPFYFLAKEVSNRKTAILTTTLFLVTPIHWVLSEVALTNIPGMFFATLTACLLYKAKGSKNCLLLASFLAGITLGVRFAEYSIVLSLLILVLIHRKKAIDVIKSGVYLAAGVLAWLVPLILDTGWSEFLNAYNSQVVYIASHDSLFGSNLTFINRLSQVWKLFLAAYTPFFIPILVFTAYYFLKNKRVMKRFNNLFILVWFFSYLIPLVIVYNLEVPRHVLPLLPPLVLMSAATLKSLKGRLGALVYFAFVFVIFLISLSQVKKQHSLIPPSIAPVLYVKENFSPDRAIVISTFIYRQFQYYAPEFENYWGTKNTPEYIDSEIVIIDFLKLKDQIPITAEYNITEEKTFIGPEEVFLRLSRTNLYIFEKK